MIPHSPPRRIDPNPSQNFEKQEDEVSPGYTKSEVLSPSKKKSFAKPRNALPKKYFLNITYSKLIYLVMTYKSKGNNRHHGF
jgi:hypothetical protein